MPHPDARPTRFAGAGPLATLVFWARQDKVREIAGQAAVLLALLAASILIAVIADHLLRGGLPAGWRIGVGVLCLGTAGVGAGIITALALSRRTNLAYIAQRAERAAGVRHNALISAILLDAAPAESHARQAAVSQALAIMSSLPTSLPTARGASRPWLAAGLVVLAWAAYFVLAPKSVATSLQRLAGADIAAPTATQITLIRPAADDVVRVNTPLEIEIELTGAAVDDVALHIVPASSSAVGELIAEARRIRSESGADRRIFALAPFQVQGDLAYHIAAGDAVLTGVIHVLAMPSLETIEITLTPPAYAHQAARQVRGDFTALAGTRASFRLTASAALKQAVMIYSEGARETRTRLRVDSARPSIATLEMPLLVSGAYQFEIADDAGGTVLFREAGRITVRPDEPPRFLGVSEAGGAADAAFVQEIEHKQTWPALVASAEDDVAIEQGWFVVQVGAETTRVPLSLTRPEADGPVEMSADLEAVAPRAMLEGVAWFEVQDGRVLPDGRLSPQTTNSPTIRLARRMQHPRDKDAEQAPVKGPEPDDRAAEEVPAAPPADDAAEEAEGAEDGAKASEQADGDADAQGEPTSPPDADESSADEALDEFVREHGQEAAEAERVRRGEGAEPEEPAETPPQSGGDSEGEGQGQGELTQGEMQDGQQSGEPGEQPGGDAQDPAEPEKGAAPEEGKSNGESAEQGAEPAADGSRGRGPGKPGDAQQSASDSGGGGATEGARKSVVDLLEGDEKGNPVTVEGLVRAGWPEAKATAFVRDLARLREKLRQQEGGAAALRARSSAAVSETTEVQQGAPQVRPAVNSESDEKWEDRLRSIAPPADEHAPDHLRAVLEAYYRAVAEQAARGSVK